MAVNVEFTLEPYVTVDAEIEIIIKNVCAECAPDYDDSLNAGVHLTGNADMKDINNRFRNIDKATDVLSFPLLEGKDGDIVYTELDRYKGTGSVMLGDIVISVDKAREQAEDYDHSFKREIAFLTCHGMLHLLGYDHEDKNDELIMIERQNQVLNKLGYTK